MSGAPAWFGRPEGPRLEYKGAAAGAETLAPVVVGFLNSGGGTLVLGVRDDGSLEGVPQARERAERLLPLLLDRIEPSPEGLVRATPVSPGGVEVLQIDVDAGGGQVFAEGQRGRYCFWSRAGDQVRPLGWTEVLERLDGGGGGPPGWARDLSDEQGTVLVLVAEEQERKQPCRLGPLADRLERARSAIDGRVLGWTVLPPGAPEVRGGEATWGGRDQARRLVLAAREGRLVARFEGRDRFLVWKQPTGVAGPVLYPFPATEGPATFCRLLGRLAMSREPGPVRLTLGLWNARGWSLGPGRPDSFGWAIPATSWTAPVGEQALAVHHHSSWAALASAPEREAWGLVVQLYEWFGYGEESVPFWDEGEGLFRFE